MNIVHVIASPSPGGIESFVRDLAVATTESGQSVHIGFLETASEAGTSEKFENEYLSELESAGVGYFFIGRDARWWLWRGVGKIRKYVRDNSIDVYHSHLTYGIAFGAFVPVPRVYTHHSIDMRVGRLAFTLMIKFIEQLVGISDKCAEALSRHSTRKVVTIFNGVDLKKFSQERLAVRKIERVINCISVGRICVEKNYELLVEAIARLPVNIRSRLSVRIAGTGPATVTAGLQEKILANGLEDVISLLGVRSDIPALLASSDLFLMSSSSEGLPIALIEAAAAGLPCVVTDAGGCREVVEACRNGIVVDTNNADALATAIERIVTDGVKFSSYSANALNHSSQFSIENAAVSHALMYRQLLSLPRGEGS